MKKKQIQKKKIKNIVEEGTIHIKSTFNNTIVTVSDQQGKPIIVQSCGMHGFSGTRKSTPHAATVTMTAALRSAVEDHGMRKAEIFVKGIGPGREASLRSLRNHDIDISKISDVTPIPHNGVRPPKVRRG